MAIKIKRDKYRGKVEIWDGHSHMLASFSERIFGEIIEAGVQFYLGKKMDFKIVSNSEEGKVKGFYRYHLVKNFILAIIWDIKQKRKNPPKE